MPPQILGDGTGTGISAEDRGVPVLAGCSNLLPIRQVAFRKSSAGEGTSNEQRRDHGELELRSPPELNPISSGLGLLVACPSSLCVLPP